ncbi:MAG: BolA family transcriptional regulator [Proteobacteria bacterium]|nr:BolA family transcriptional regulator [Pseudomonadota bacterium]
MRVADIITAKLREAFSPDQLEVIDVSEQHRGHGGWREGGETHFHVVMRTKAFNGKSRLTAQRAVNKILAEELSGPVHALTMEVRGVGD